MVSPRLYGLVTEINFRVMRVLTAVATLVKVTIVEDTEQEG